jgi:GntR family transcriptional repressor for pyruvate dehydrogenase complex
MPRFQAVKQTKVYAGIVEQIRNLIEQGDLQPGERLPSERTLSTNLNIGRQSLREALSVLEATGLLEVRHGIGTFVTQDALCNITLISKEDSNLDNPFELLEARKVIESKIVSLAAKRATSEEIAEMEKALGALRIEMNEGRHPLELDRELHLAFARGAHNQILYRSMTEIIEQMSKHIWTTFKEKCLEVSGRAEKYHSEHEEVFHAIQRRDSRRAAQAMSVHLNNVGRDFLQS